MRGRSAATTVMSSQSPGPGLLTLIRARAPTPASGPESSQSTRKWSVKPRWFASTSRKSNTSSRGWGTVAVAVTGFNGNLLVNVYLRIAKVAVQNRSASLQGLDHAAVESGLLPRRADDLARRPPEDEDRRCRDRACCDQHREAKPVDERRLRVPGEACALRAAELLSQGERSGEGVSRPLGQGAGRVCDGARDAGLIAAGESAPQHRDAERASSTGTRLRCSAT